MVNKQMSLFESVDSEESSVQPVQRKKKVVLSDADSKRLFTYKLEDYVHDVESLGLSDTWARICEFVIVHHNEIPAFLHISHFGELYEIGLAIQDKLAKKKSGQYYTPDDVASVMSRWLQKCEGKAVCDVACGTGKLILTYLDLIGYKAARELIQTGNLYLYDFDEVALNICKTSISVKYGLDIAPKIHAIYGDFLDRKVTLPKNAKVISNPPYAKISAFPISWQETEVLRETMEFYSAFMEKVFTQARSTVIITPFSFISGAKFYSLRKLMCLIGGGFIVAFDNVPGNIFCGRKHGIFNTNTANSVRAAITVFDQNSPEKGFRVTPLIRFKNEERDVLLKCDVLEGLLGDAVQTVDDENRMFRKVFKELDTVYDRWISNSSYRLSDLVTGNSSLLIDMPNTCRYYTTGSSKKLARGGSIILHPSTSDDYAFLYCFINSSFTYWWWRIFDGGITYPLGLLMDMPIPYNLLTPEDRVFFETLAEEMISKEKDFVVTKANAGAVQENIKFPETYRNAINERLLSILGCNCNPTVFKNVHKNSFLGE